MPGHQENQRSSASYLLVELNPASRSATGIMSRDGHESLNKQPVLAKRKDASATVWLSPAGDSSSQVNALFGFYSFIAQV